MRFGAEPDGVADRHRVFFAERIDSRSVRRWERLQISEKMKIKKANEKRGKLLNLKKSPVLKFKQDC